jgi:hypothetical protein
MSKIDHSKFGGIYGEEISSETLSEIESKQVVVVVNPINKQ